ncbi:hypothetical protein ACFJGX_26940 [Hydrogenophaga sp. UC242_50]|uniref:hypothetical protein n=1 Tax=Hydrogenophaga sp. UC242_50 TaxID=3350169 RepID=UPI0036D23FF8
MNTQQNVNALNIPFVTTRLHAMPAAVHNKVTKEVQSMLHQPHGSWRRAQGLTAGLLLVFGLVGCKSLPRVVPDLDRRPPPVRLEGSQGPLSAERSRAILERLRAGARAATCSRGTSRWKRPSSAAP